MIEMSDANSNPTDESQKNKNADNGHDPGDEGEGVHVVHIGDQTEKFHDDTVKAREIISLVESDASEFTLEARSGNSTVEEWSPDEPVDLTEKHRSHFRVMGRGGGNS